MLKNQFPPGQREGFKIREKQLFFIHLNELSKKKPFFKKRSSNREAQRANIYKQKTAVCPSFQ